ncbi:permease, partial [Leptospira borgpetersenii serovar Hardjo-bovis]|nr:permease [Leptospira borgpetersenii serovar Hardjo-bovis]
GMMCTCCAAPVAAGMRRQSVSMGGALAFWLGNPLLNPATLVFMGFVLGWEFTLIRVAVGLVMVIGIASLVQRFVADMPAPALPESVRPAEAPQGSFMARWFRALWTRFWHTIP